jgi:hypothetical protein
MAKKQRFTESLAAGGATIMCMDPHDIAGLTPEQISAMHMCKHEIMAAMCRLYTLMPQERADQVLSKYLNFPQAA